MSTMSSDFTLTFKPRRFLSLRSLSASLAGLGVVLLGMSSARAAAPTPSTPLPSVTILSIAKSLLDPNATNSPYLVRTAPTFEGCAYGFVVIKDDAAAAALVQSATAARDTRSKVNLILAADADNVCIVNAITVATAPSGVNPQAGGVTVAESFSGYNNRFATSHKAAYRDFSQGKFDESIDPVSGRLILSYNDVVIPGPNGLDIKVVRSYHSPDVTQTIAELAESFEPKFNGLGWNVHVNYGGVRGLHINNICVPVGGINDPGGYFFSIENMPSWITAEGRAIPMTPYTTSPLPGSGGWWVTPSGIRIACQFEQNGLLPVAVLPNGTRIELGQASSQTEQTIPGTENGRRNNYLPTKITDRWGNWIAFEYLTSYTNQAFGLGSLVGGNNSGSMPITRITASDGRVVTFTYASSAPGWITGQPLPLADFALKQIDYGSYSVKYNYTRLSTGNGGLISATAGKYFLQSVERPDGKVWNYTTNLTGHTNATLANPNLSQYLLSSVTFPQGGVTSYTWGFSTRLTPQLPPNRPPRPFSNQVRLKTTSDGGTWRYVYTDSPRNANDTADDIPDPVTGLNVAPFVVIDPTNPAVPPFEGSRITGPTGIEVFYHAPRFFQVTNPSGENPGAVGGPIQALGLIRQHSVFPLGTNFRNSASPPTPIEKTTYTHEATYPSMIELRQGFPDANGLPNPPDQTASLNYHSRVLSKTTRRGPSGAPRDYSHANGTFSFTCGEAQGATQQGQRTRRTSVTFGAFCQPIDEVLSEGDGLGNFTRKQRIVRTLTADTKNVERITWYGPTDANSVITERFTYQATGDVASKTDAVNSVTRYNDYKRGTPREELHPTVRGGDANTEAAGTRIRIARVVDDLGRITSETDGEGRTVEFTYNGEHKPLTITLPRVTTARTIQFTYNSNNDVIAQGSRTEQVNYDGFGRVNSYNNGLFTTNYAHDAAGRRFFVSYPGKSEGQTVTFDALNRPLTFTEPNPSGAGNVQTIMAYLDNEHAMTVTNARNFTSKTTYESFADPSDTWIKSQEQPDNAGTLRYDRNVFGQPETIAYTNALDASQSFTRGMTYDATNQYFLTVETHPELGEKRYVRDGNNNMMRSSVVRGAATTGETIYTYDGQNRLATVTPPGGDSAPSISRTWYKTSKPNTITAGSVNRSHLFDDNDNLTSETVTIDGIARTLGYTYNELDHLSRNTYPSGDTVDYAPDVIGRPTQALPFVSTIAHHPSGLVSSLTYANGVVQTFDERATRPLPSAIGVRKFSTNTQLLSLGFGYDSVANLLTLTDSLNLGYARNNGFDGFDRITSSGYPSNPSANESFAYKGIGDFDTKSGAGTLAFSQTFNYNASTRRLDSISAANALYARTYSYDGYGNASGDGRFNYSYDAYSTLRQSRNLNGTTIADYVYDGLHHLAKKTSTNPPNGNTNLATVHYLYSSSGKLFGEYPANSTSNGKEFAYASGKMVGQSVRGGSSSNAISVNGTGPINPTWYIGKPQDTTTGLVYFGARWYDPITGRFLGFDPAEVTDENPHSFNRYAYGNNNPYKYLDPDGRAVADIFPANAPIVTIANNFAAIAAFIEGKVTNNQTLVNVATQAMSESRQANVEALGVIGSLGRGTGPAAKSTITPSAPAPTPSSPVAPPPAPNFVVSPNGTVFPVPQGAKGPVPVINPAGAQTGNAYVGGSGGANKQVDSMRIMNPTPARGNAPAYPKGYIKYENSQKQGVDPNTGKTLPNNKSHHAIE
jgi:RHS repeat-associated protein